ncbi:MAG: DMT family transporter [bacterium]
MIDDAYRKFDYLVVRLPRRKWEAVAASCNIPMKWLHLAFAICLETIGTYSLKYANGFGRWWLIPFIVLGYGGAYYFLSLVLQRMQVNVAYAVWSAAAIILTLLVDAIWLRQHISRLQLLGIVLVLLGILAIQLSTSGRTGH